MQSLDWLNDVVPASRAKLKAYVIRKGHKPILRTLYYILFKKGVVPGTNYHYKKLSEAIVKAKTEGTFSRGLIYRHHKNNSVIMEKVR